MPLDEDGDPEGYDLLYVMEQCGACGEVSLQVYEDYYLDGSAEGSSPDTIYPEEQRLSPQIPESLRREFDEAKLCFSTKAYTASTVMVRRTLEGAWQESGVSEGSLFKRLIKLKEMDLLDDTLEEWANELRALGNEGAHYTGSSVAREVAEDALAFTEALLDHIFVFRKRFEEFKKRRSRAP
jgi:hypothetical protein